MIWVPGHTNLPSELGSRYALGTRGIIFYAHQEQKIRGNFIKGTASQDTELVYQVFL
jgi:hypothetical protein